MGRASTRTPEIEDQVIRQLTDGVPLTVICMPAHMPAPRTIQDWEAQDPEFAASIARARDAGEFLLAWECKQIADTPMAGEETELDSEGNVVKVKRSDMLAHRKLQIETRLKLLAKFNPKRWGEQVKLEHSGKLSWEQMVSQSLQPTE